MPATTTTWTSTSTTPSLFSRSNKRSLLLPPGFSVPPLFTPQEEEELRKRSEQEEEEERRKSSSSSSSQSSSSQSSSPSSSPSSSSSSSSSKPSSSSSSPSLTLPRHVGIILDGNTRWARRRGLPPRAGHAAGALALSRAVACCRAWGVERLTVFAFSSENWRRPRADVASVMAVARRAARELSPALAEARVRVRFVGDRGSLPKSLAEACEAAEAATADCCCFWEGGNEEEEEGKDKGLLLTVALAYGARADAAAAARALAAACVAGELDPGSIDEGTFARALSTAAMPAAFGGKGKGGDETSSSSFSSHHSPSAFGKGKGARGGEASSPSPSSSSSSPSSSATSLSRDDNLDNNGNDANSVDLQIRTAGERRLSNFLLLESAYAELVFLEELWPDVGAEELRRAVREFMGRERRFGGESRS